MLWNIWYYHLKWREMLDLIIPWCYGSKKNLWIQSVLGLWWWWWWWWQWWWRRGHLEKKKKKKEKKKPWQASGEGESVRTGAPRLLLPVSPATLQHWKTFSFPSCSYEKVLKFNTLYRPTTGGRLYQHFSFFKSFSTCLLSLNNLLH